MNKLTDVFQRLSSWQLVFLQSKVNSAPYHGEELPHNNWEWPKDTYLQRRLRYVKESQSPDFNTLKLSAEERHELLYKKLFDEYRHN